MKKLIITTVLIGSICTGVFSQKSDSLIARTIYDEALTKGESYEMLEYLCLSIGHRLSGSPQAAAAVEWARQKMVEYEFDKVELQEVMVPHWVRGDLEYGKIVNSAAIGTKEVPICALGGSIATGSNGVTARVIEVTNFDQLEELGRKGIEGKFVFYNRPMDARYIHTGSAYGGAVDQRHLGAAMATKYGAVGVLVRSMTLAIDDVPHTGSMKYDSVGIKIPGVAISTKGANLLSGLLKNDPNLMFHMELNCKTLPDVLSYNVIGEMEGTEYPDEIILVGGHLDAWDKGHGAHDDGAGCVQSIEALRILKVLGIKPKRTIRAVMFMNEENGLRGAKKYAAVAKEKGENHIAAIESDAGGFTPRGFGIYGEPEALKKIQSFSRVFDHYGIIDLKKGWGGADINQLKDQGVTLIGYRPDSQRYFDLHHTSEDTFDKINKRELELGAASMAVLVYLLSEYGL